MARISRLKVQGYRSVGPGGVELLFPPNTPLVLVGENNAGKSNIVKAVSMVLGEFWPGNYDPEDHEYFGRSPLAPISIEIHFDPTDKLSGEYIKLDWLFRLDNEKPTFRVHKSTGYTKTPSNEERDGCIGVTVDANRSLRREMSYQSKWTFLSRLMLRFHRALTSQPKVKSELEELFEEIRGKFQGIDVFNSFLSSLQNDFEDLSANMTHRLKVDFSAYNPTNFFHALKLQAVENGAPRTIEELGTGEEQILAMAFAHAYAKAFHTGILLIIEEPEAHLHPLMQEWLAKKINKMAKDGLQILITTHSPAFLDMLNLEGVVLVRKKNGSTTTTQITAAQLAQFCREHGADTRAQAATILPFYSGTSNNDVLSGFFAKKIVLVEGQTEAMALPVYLSRVDLDVTREGIAIIPAGGKGNLAKWWRLFSVYGFPVYVIFDNDGNDDENQAKRKDILKTLGISRTEIQRLIGSDDWIIGDSFSVFGRDFETSLKETFDDYVALEAEAVEIVGGSKPLKARYVAERLGQDIFEDANWSKFQELAEKLRNLTLCGQPPDEEELPF